MSDITLPFTIPPQLRRGLTQSMIDNSHALFIGDSNAFQMIEDDAGAAFIAALAGYGITATVTEAARSGSNLLTSVDTDAWWDDTTNGIGVLWNAEVGILPNQNDITDIFCSLPLNDLLAVGTIDAATVKTAYQGLINHAFAQLPALQRFFLLPLLRPTTGGDDVEWASIRQIEEELVAENANVYRAGEGYHLVNADQEHLDNASELTRQHIAATALAGVGGNTDLTGLGMIVSSVEVQDDGLLCTIDHRDGTDWTLPLDTSNTMAAFGVYSGDNDQSLSGDIMTKISATQAKITSPAISDCRVVVVDGAMGDLAGFNVDPNVAFDNSALELPFGRSTPLITYADPILGMTGMTEAAKSNFIKTFSSGVVINQMNSLNTGTWAQDSASSTVEYDAMAFAGYGGFISNQTADRLETGLAMNAQFWQALAVQVPNTPSADVHLHQLGTNGTPSSNNIMWIESTNGNIIYDAREGDGNPVTISTDDWRGKNLIIVIDAKGVDDWDVHIYDEFDQSTILINFNPNNNYTGRNRVYHCGGDAVFGDFYMRVGTSLGYETGDLTSAQIIDQIRVTHGLG